jgi:hypothetical protein
MQHVGEPGSPEMNRNDKPAGGLSPAQAFFALMALLVAIGGLFLLTRPNEEPGPGSAPKSDNFALTNAEAIERFKDLNALAIQATRRRDVTLLNQTFTGDGPMRKRALTVIQSLREDNVFEKSRIEVVGVSVVDNQRALIRLRVIDRLYPCFVTEAGRDVSESHRPIERVGIWTMRREGSLWKLDESSLEEDRFLGKDDAIACP